MRKDSGLYRPTVRYEEYFRSYIEELFHCTRLDRNELFRAALFFLGSDPVSRRFLATHLKKDKQLPPPLTDRDSKNEFFLGSGEFLKGGTDVPLIQEGGTSVIVKSKGIKLIVRSDRD